MKTKPYFFIIILIVASLACSFGIPNLSRLEIGSEHTFTISEPRSDTDQAQDVNIAMTFGKLALSGGTGALLEGKVRYNVEDWEPRVTSGDHSLSISQGESNGVTLDTSSDRVVNDWDIHLGDQPMNLTLSAGAYEADLDLSGLALLRLVIQDGASDSLLRFDTLNPVVMQELVYQTGTSDIKFTGLANANFKEMSFDGGAGSYTFDFSGALQRDAVVHIEAGLSDIRVVVPEGVSAQVTLEKALGDVELDDAWSREGSLYVNPGSGSQLTITIEMGAGTLHLANQ